MVCFSHYLLGNSLTLGGQIDLLTYFFFYDGILSHLPPSLGAPVTRVLLFQVHWQGVPRIHLLEGHTSRKTLPRVEPKLQDEGRFAKSWHDQALCGTSQVLTEHSSSEQFGRKIPGKMSVRSLVASVETSAYLPS